MFLFRILQEQLRVIGSLNLIYFLPRPGSAAAIILTTSGVVVLDLTFVNGSMPSSYHNFIDIFRGYPVTKEPKLEEVQCLMEVDGVAELYSGICKGPLK